MPKALATVPSPPMLAEVPASLAEQMRAWMKAQEPKATSIVLAHIIDGAAPNILDTVELNEELRLDPDALARRLERAAAAHCDAVGGSERYSVACKEGRNVWGQFWLRLDPAAGLVSPSRATPEAFLTAGLRHVEKMTELTQHAASATIGNLGRQVERQSAELERLRAQHVRTCELFESLMDRKLERELAAEAEKRHQERIDQAVDIGADLAKIIGAHYAGAGPLEVLISKMPKAALDAVAEALDEDGRKALRDAMAHVQRAQGARERILSLVRPKDGTP